MLWEYLVAGSNPFGQTLKNQIILANLPTRFFIDYCLKLRKLSLGGLIGCNLMYLVPLNDPQASVQKEPTVAAAPFVSSKVFRIQHVGYLNVKHL